MEEPTEVGCRQECLPHSNKSVCATSRIVIWLLAVPAFAQSTAGFEESVRAAMAPAIAQQRASVHKQVVAASKPAGVSNGGGFFSTPPIVTAFTECPPMPTDELNGLVDNAAQKEGVSADLIHAVIEEESAAKPCAISYSGAQGLMQLMPATADQFEVRDPFDPRQNIDAGTKLLKLLLNRYDNDIGLTLGAYNAGPSRVDQEGGIPRIPETLNYVSDILKKLHVLEDKKPLPADARP
jgi:hypothetical protein